MPTPRAMRAKRDQTSESTVDDVIDQLVVHYGVSHLVAGISGMGGLVMTLVYHTYTARRTDYY